MKFRKRDKVYCISTISADGSEFVDWVQFYWVWRFGLTYDICGYFDNRPRLKVDFIFFSLTLILPFRNEWTDECDPPIWGVAISHNTFWVHLGGSGNGGNKWWAWDIPFISKKWVRRSILLENNTWEHESPGDEKSFHLSEWDAKKKTWRYNFTDKYDGEIIPAKITVEEMEWRPKWLTWTNLFAKVRRVIEVSFEKEVGERKGSWKGGVLGCGYELLDGESPVECIKRMETEKEF
jgi:hypothetical protein